MSGFGGNNGLQYGRMQRCPFPFYLVSFIWRGGMSFREVVLLFTKIWNDDILFIISNCNESIIFFLGSICRNYLDGGKCSYIRPKLITTIYQGPVGPKGQKGERGQQGPSGHPGQKGQQGPRGEAGGKGQQGPVGPSGQGGQKGQQGPVGPRGQDGEKGEQGPVGPPGNCHQEIAKLENKFAKMFEEQRQLIATHCCS